MTLSSPTGLWLVEEFKMSSQCTPEDIGLYASWRAYKGVNKMGISLPLGCLLAHSPRSGSLHVLLAVPHRLTSLILVQLI